MHASVWSAIDRIAADNDLSASGLAVEIGMDCTAFNKSKRITHGKPHWPSVGTVALIIERFGLSFSDFARLVDGSTASRLQDAAE
jgi:hypothetical protein